MYDREEMLLQRIKELEEEVRRLKARLTEVSWREERTPRYDSWGQFDGYYD